VKSLPCRKEALIRYRKICDECKSAKAAFHDINTGILARMSVSMSVSWNAAFKLLVKVTER